jgi:hypothetical protein
VRRARVVRHELRRNPGGRVVAAGPGDLQETTPAWSPSDAKFAERINGDASALAYNHIVKTSEAQYGDIYTIHTFADRSTVQRVQGLPACSGTTSGGGRGSLVRSDS